MIRNWLLTAIRGFGKNKLSTVINLLGLTGLAPPDTRLPAEA